MTQLIPVHFRETVPFNTANGPMLPGCISLSMSYDVFDSQYASPGATRKTLFNLGDEEEYSTTDGNYLKYQGVRVQPVERGQIVRIEGNNSTEFQIDRAAKVNLSGSYGFFSGSLSAEYSDNIRKCTAFRFISMTDQYHVYLLSLNVDGNLRDALTSSAREAIDHADPDELFAEYGTHYLKSLYIGATAVFSAAVNSTLFQSSSSISAAAELSYKSLTGQLSGGGSASQQTAVNKFNESSTIRISAQGGKIELAHKIANGNYDEWIASVRKHLAFVDFHRDSLQPLWNLCGDEARRELLQRKYHEYAGANYPLQDDAQIVPIYAYHTYGKHPDTSRWFYSQDPDVMPKWELKKKVAFYAYKSKVPGTVPVYEHTASSPQRFKFSRKVKEGNHWSDGKEPPAFYAYDSRGDGRIAINQFSAEKNSGQSGWYYNQARTVNGWVSSGPAFYTPEIEGPGFVS